MVHASDKLGLVLSGGGARGAFAAGVLEVLSDDPRFDTPHVAAGTSAGAISAALLASGKSAREMREFWLGLESSTIAHVSGGFFRELLGALVRAALAEPARTLAALRRRIGQGGSVHPGNLLAALCEVLLADRYDLVRAFTHDVRECFVVDTAKLRKRLVDAFGGEEVPTPRCGLAINVVDAKTNRAVRFLDRPVDRPGDDYVVVERISVDMVLASASLPLLFPPVWLEPRLLWDGGVLNNTPLAPAVAAGADRIVTVLVTDARPLEQARFTNLADALGRLIDMFLENAHNVDRSLLLARSELARASQGSHYREVVLYDVIRPTSDDDLDAASLLYFEHGEMARLYENGRRAAACWLRAGPRVQGVRTGQAPAPQVRVRGALVDTRKEAEHDHVS